MSILLPSKSVNVFLLFYVFEKIHSLRLSQFLEFVSNGQTRSDSHHFNILKMIRHIVKNENKKNFFVKHQKTWPIFEYCNGWKMDDFASVYMGLNRSLFFGSVFNVTFFVWKSWLGDHRRRKHNSWTCRILSSTSYHFILKLTSTK